ncbi:hypothetical protein [Gottfriedia acidiceleris]|uniref:hypothetical protein n=1 Tax=Gottfriedia acidiceleris TaxID=371036 RepID=UPI003B58AB8C
MQQVFARKHKYNYLNAMVITNSNLSETAINLAKKLNVTVWSRNTPINKASLVNSNLI